MAVRAKFKVESYSSHLNYGDPSKELRTIRLAPVHSGSEENKKFYEATPSGSIELGTLNKAAWEQFPLGAEFYVDFTKAG